MNRLPVVAVSPTDESDKARARIEYAVHIAATVIAEAEAIVSAFSPAFPRAGTFTIGAALPREGRRGSHKRAISDRSHSRSGNAKQRRTAARSARRRLAAAPPAFAIEYEDGDFTLDAPGRAS